MTSLIRSPHLGSNVARISLLRNKLITHRPHYSASGDTSPSEDHARVRQYARSILSQKIGILKLISSEDYNRKSDRSSSVGGHMRHSLDHFDSVLGVREDNSVLDYDSRNRNTDVERFEDAALLKCMNLLSRLTTLTSDLPVQVKFISDPSTGSTFILPSSTYRELAFVTHHAVHHLSSIKNIMEALGYDFKDSCIGFANSTILNDKIGASGKSEA